MPSSADRAQQARRFAIEAARLAANTRCHNVVVLDVTGLSPVTDFFVLATGTSPRQMRTVMDDINELAGQNNMSCLSNSGLEGETWMLCDLVDVVVHIFSSEARMFYDLESLWGDAKKIEWKDESAPAAVTGQSQLKVES